ncbi:MAG: hypothetical protein L0271_23945 [Gemmatimonadetes bacterium]|nr:hypothetical protein [Gemmatimonadota bacterium]
MAVPPQDSVPSEPSHDADARRLHPEICIARRRARLEKILHHPLVPPRPSDASLERRTFLREEAEELYWNELEWEKLMAEEMSVGGSELVELAFPGFLALIDGLLLKEASPDSPVPANPRPEVVEDILLFLARRFLELLPETSSESRLEREMTQRLIDLVLYRLHGLEVDGIDPFELSRRDDIDDVM